MVEGLYLLPSCSHRPCAGPAPPGKLTLNLRFASSSANAADRCWTTSLCCVILHRHSVQACWGHGSTASSL